MDVGALSNMIHRLVKKLASLVDANNDVISYAYHGTREYNVGILDHVRGAGKWTSKPMPQIVDEHGVPDGGTDRLRDG